MFIEKGPTTIPLHTNCIEFEMFLAASERGG